jgi:PrcB C-terminal
MTKPMVIGLTAPYLLLSLVLGGCAMTGVDNLDASEILLYGLGERHVILYGSAQSNASTLSIDGQQLEVTGKPVTGPMAVPTALSIGGKPTLQLKTAPIREVFALASIPFSGDLSLTTRAGLEGVYAYDGRAWLDVTGVTNADMKLRVPAKTRNGLRGVGQLSDAEADALAGYLSSKGAVGVALLPLQTAPDQPLRFDPQPRQYRRTALYVQVGLPTDVLGVFAQNAPLEYDVLGTGGNTAYTNQQPGVRLDATAASLGQTWGIIGGNQIPAPTPPSVDFNRSRIVTVFLGQKPTGGFGIAVAGAKLDGSTLSLEVNLREPSTGSILTQALTSPYVSVRVNSTAITSVRVINKANGQVIAKAP